MALSAEATGVKGRPAARRASRSHPRVLASSGTAEVTKAPPSSAGDGKPETAQSPLPPPPAPAAPSPEPVLGQSLYEKAAAGGAAFANAPFMKTFILSILAGCFVGTSALLCFTVGGNVPELAASNPGLQRLLFGSVGLPMGLMLVLMTGSPLFTGMTALVPAAVLEKKANLSGLAKVWTSSFFGNIIGCMMVIGLASVAGMPPSPAPATVAATKTSLPFMKVFARAIYCNTLVCTAIISFMSANTWGSKFLAVLLPISCFVALGLEHSIASAFMIPWGIVQGSSATLPSFFNYMIPATLGNTIGGLLLAFMLSAAYGAVSKTINAS